MSSRPLIGLRPFPEGYFLSWGLAKKNGPRLRTLKPPFPVELRRLLFPLAARTSATQEHHGTEKIAKVVPSTYILTLHNC